MSKDGIGVSVVMMSEPRLRSAKTYGTTLQKWFPGIPVSIGKESTDEIRILTVDKYDVYLSLMPPVPWNQVESLTKNSWHWKESNELLRKHKAHILIAMMKGPEGLIEKAMFLSRVTAAVLDSQDALGVLWGGPAISPKKMFIESVQEATEGGHYPLLSWVSFAIVPESDSVSVVTQGMDALGHREMEVISNRGDGSIIKYTMTLCDYVLKKGPILLHGQTIGRTAGEKFSITHRPWRWDKSKGAIVIDMRNNTGGGKGFLARLFGR